jgi:nicotinamide phosphoribosyltransferase
VPSTHTKHLTLPKNSPEIKGVIELLWDIFGGTVNEQGYKVLNPHIGCIYGDSITLERATQICEGLKKKGFASTNVVFGIGSYTYQYVTRDTDGYAVKATYAKIAGKEMEIFKSPKGAEFKKSAKGLTAVFKDENGEFYLKDQATWEEVLNCEFVKVFENGVLMKDYTLQEVRDNLAQYV